LIGSRRHHRSKRRGEKPLRNSHRERLLVESAPKTLVPGIADHREYLRKPSVGGTREPRAHGSFRTCSLARDVVVGDVHFAVAIISRKPAGMATERGRGSISHHDRVLAVTKASSLTSPATREPSTEGGNAALPIVTLTCRPVDRLGEGECVLVPDPERYRSVRGEELTAHAHVGW